MRVLMFGWEFPPIKTGGLGTACYGLTKGLKHNGVDVTFVVPWSCSVTETGQVKIIGSVEPQIVQKQPEKRICVDLAESPKPIESPDNVDVQACLEESEEYSHVELIKIDTPLFPYERPEQHFEVRTLKRRTERKIPAESQPSSGISSKETPHKEKQPEVREIQREVEPEIPKAVDPPDKTIEIADLYGEGLSGQVREYTSRVKTIVEREKFDIIHAHDWMTFQAGIVAKRLSGKPLVIHVHSTEYDRTGGAGLDSIAYKVERFGAQEADQIITVSNWTKRILIKNYGASVGKINVVYNAVDTDNVISHKPLKGGLDRKIVLFLGRITIQKGPELFLEAASKVLRMYPDVMFVMAGSGDMMYEMIEKAAALRIGHRVLFPGFLRGAELDRMYDMADLYVMPSVSEPFGITPLEAMSHGVPVIISKQSGVSEVVRNALKVDFWNVDKLADKIVAVLKYGTLHDMMGRNGKSEIKRYSWDDSAVQCIGVYNKTLGISLPKKRIPA